MELETLGPVITLASGQSVSAENVCALSQRGEGDDFAVARRALGLR